MARSLKLFVEGGFGPCASTRISGVGLLSMFHRSSMLKLANERSMGRNAESLEGQKAVLVSVTGQDGVMRRSYRSVQVYVLPDGEIVLPSDR